jgi:hypothetical protein
VVQTNAPIRLTLICSSCSAEMAFECPLSVWGAKSQVLHAVSHHGPLGPYERVGVAIPTEARNPVLSRATDGTWLIWTCGCPHTAANTSCMREKLIFPGGAEAAWTTTVYSSKSLTGPWEAHVNTLGNLTPGKLGSQNVSPPSCKLTAWFCLCSKGPTTIQGHQLPMQPAGRAHIL